jgi:hypothetical protein
MCFNGSSNVSVDVNCNIDCVLNAGRQRMVRTSANKDAIIEAVERQQWKSASGTARGLGLWDWGSLKYFLTTSGYDITTGGKKGFSQTIVLYAYFMCKEEAVMFWPSGTFRRLVVSKIRRLNSSVVYYFRHILFFLINTKEKLCTTFCSLCAVILTAS